MNPLSWRRKRRLPLPKLPLPDLEKVKGYFFPMFWQTPNVDRVAERLASVVEILPPGVHCADNLLTWARSNSMLDDPQFLAAFNDNAESNADKAIIWRRYVLCCIAFHCVHLRGDFVECGAYTGVGVKTVVDYLGATQFPKTFWMYDLFEHEPAMLHEAMAEHGPGLESRVRGKFADYPQVKVYKGCLPEVLAGQSPAAIAYLHIDLNQAPAEIAALDALFDRVTPGGIVVLDDYEWAGVYRLQKLMEDEWFERRDYRVIALPTGQGIVIKR